MARGIWVWIEMRGGRPAEVSLELLGEARVLAEKTHWLVGAVVTGYGLREVPQLLWEYGADQVYLADHPQLAEPVDDRHVTAVVEAVQQGRPEVLLLGATAWGKALAPKVAARLGTGLTADATQLELDPATGVLEVTKPAYGGNAMATIICPEKRPQMVSIRPHVFRLPQRQAGRQGEVIPVELPAEIPARLAFLERLPAPAPGRDITTAKVVVAGGRGVSREGFKLLEELAAVLGGVVGVTRPISDAGWYPESCMIGQTGCSIAPRLYIACGLSGAVQHLAGVHPEVIVAINTDPDAPIHRVADYSIIGDVAEVVPALTAEVRRVLGR